MGADVCLKLGREKRSRQRYLFFSLFTKTFGLALMEFCQQKD